MFVAYSTSECLRGSHRPGRREHRTDGDSTRTAPVVAKAGTSALNDVTSGSNGSCSTSYFCTAKSGYDGPTGWGTPEGVAAFTG